MATANLITYILSALEDVEFLEEKLDTWSYEREMSMRLRFRLRSLKKFVLICSRHLVNDASLRSVFLRIEDTVRRNADEIHPLCLQSNGQPTDLHREMISDFEGHMMCLDEKIEEWYCTWRSSSSCTKYDALEFIDSILEALVDVRGTNADSLCLIKNLVETIEALEDQMLFMKRLISLATKIGGVDLWAHAESFTINAAYLLFTFEFSWGDLVSKLSILVKNAKPIDSKVCQAYTKAFNSSKLQTRRRRRRQKRIVTSTEHKGDAFVAMKDLLDSLLSNLWELLRLSTFEVCMKDVQDLYGGLRSLRAILKHQPPSNFSMIMKQEIGDAICDAGVYICSLHQTQTQVHSAALPNLWNLIHNIRAEIVFAQPQVPMSSFPGQAVDGVLSPSVKAYVINTCSASNNQETEMKMLPSQEAATIANENEVIGLHEEEMQIVDRLERGSQQLRIVFIVGMAGLGKTTLATKAYNSPSVTFHFHIRAWCPISQVVDKKKVLLDLLHQIDPCKCSKEISEADLENRLRQSLIGSRYLIFLDDIWDDQVWNCMKGSFPDGGVGSRIILTSRQHDIVPHDMMVDQKPYSLRQMTDEESLELLLKRSSYTQIGLPPLSVDLRKKIAEKCRGLPLLIVILAGLLKTVDFENWDDILDGLSNVSGIEQCKCTLELSYNRLPVYLRPCFLYFGTFREDEEVSVWRLVRLWIAEGLVQRDAAEHYLNELIGRSLIMVAKQRSLGGVKTCRIHDLIHGFCIQKAKDEHFFHFLKGYDELTAFNEPHSLQRLCIHSEAQHFKESKLFCPRARSLIIHTSDPTHISEERKLWFYIPTAIHMFKLLRVLDLEQLHFGYRFPNEIEQLVQLAFLAIRSQASRIPSWIEKLSNLQTLILRGYYQSQLPDSFWNLQKLESLYFEFDRRFPEGNLDSSATLHECDRISGALIPYRKMEGLLRKFPNIRNLKCQLIYCRDDSSNLVFPDILSRIKSLNMRYYNAEVHSAPAISLGEFSLPATLKKLTLQYFNLSWRNMSTIGTLPNLEVFKLLRTTFEGETWETKEGEFDKVKTLKLVRLKLVRWLTESYDQLNCLQKLVLDGCFSLKAIPCCLESISTLEVIEINGCYDTVVDLVKQVDEERGDSSLKIITNNIWKSDQ